MRIQLRHQLQNPQPDDAWFESHDDLYRILNKRLNDKRTMMIMQRIVSFDGKVREIKPAVMATLMSGVVWFPRFAENLYNSWKKWRACQTLKNRCFSRVRLRAETQDLSEVRNRPWSSDRWSHTRQDRWIRTKALLLLSESLVPKKANTKTSRVRLNQSIKAGIIHWVVQDVLMVRMSGHMNRKLQQQILSNPKLADTSRLRELLLYVLVKSDSAANLLAERIKAWVDSEHCLICHQDFDPKYNGDQSCILQRNSFTEYERRPRRGCGHWDCYHGCMYCSINCVELADIVSMSITNMLKSVLKCHWRIFVIKAITQTQSQND